jgi:hypothetical protein
MNDLNILEPRARSALREAFHERQQSMLSCLVSLAVQSGRELAIPVPSAKHPVDSVPKTKNLNGRLATVDKKYQSALETVSVRYKSRFQTNTGILRYRNII